MASSSSLISIQGIGMNYDWGKSCDESAVALLLTSSGVACDSNKKYAELWMGTHSSGPSKLTSDGRLLKEYLAEKNYEDLPFLLKVLSISKALSIQAHPDKSLGKVLHQRLPKEYKDDNHKPELACAITPFEALCGFESLDTILHNIEQVVELHDLLVESAGGDDSMIQKAKKAVQDKNQTVMKESLKDLFSLLMKSEPKLVSSHISAFAKRVGGATTKDQSSTEKLALRLNEAFPGDVGVFCAFFLCYRVLEPGQALFLAAREPHAYLSGDCVEIMACSDNVVRAGLTPKFRDVDALCDMLTYSTPESPSHPGRIVSSRKVDECTDRYIPSDDAVDEFELERTCIDINKTYTLKGGKKGSIILVLSGSGEELSGEKLNMGSVYLTK